MLRVLTGMVFVAHAIARLVDFFLTGFGEFLNSEGFSGGFYLAWTITIFELVRVLMMVVRKFVKLFCASEIIILLTRI